MTNEAGLDHTTAQPSRQVNDLINATGSSVADAASQLNDSTDDGTGSDLACATGLSLLERLLCDQQQLSAVDVFSGQHRHGESGTDNRYSALMPATAPGPGQQFAFEVDLDRCSGCKACVTACHTLNGLDEYETWRDVGMLVGGTSASPVMQHVTTACHHCVEPACMAACPVDAYEKHPVTGIVKHLDDQCFGCQYCTLACPYDVPKYHAGKGIVRKCDMCSARLTVGEPPACVQACPHEAIAIRVVNCKQIIEDSRADLFLPGAPEPHLTYPTTAYKTRRVFPRNLLPVDYYSVAPQHPHWPLIIMLVLTQLSVGAFVSGILVEHSIEQSLLESWRPLHSVIALSFGLLAIAASTMHLGRPLYAWRAVIGLRHSWLSREIVAFGVFATCAILDSAANWLIPGLTSDSFTGWRTGLSWSVAFSGLAGVYCSVRIYSFTQREFWCFSHTLLRFSLTTTVLGMAAICLTLLLLSLRGDAVAARIIEMHGQLICTVVIAAAVCKLIFEASLLGQLAGRQTTSLKRSALLMTGPLLNFTIVRFALGLLGGLVLPALLSGVLSDPSPNPVVAAVLTSGLFIALLTGELLERYLFFAAVAAPRMPGSLTT